MDSKSPESRAIVEAIEALADDPNAHVRFQVACSLSYLDTSVGAAAPLAKLFVSDGNDPWMRQALFVACARPGSGTHSRTGCFAIAGR